jgi:DNA polymerase I-like protein with 3'-5' exonuclease and polymerase domains
MEQYTIAKPIITHMNAIADLAEKIKKLKTKVDPDGRIRTSYNIAGTNTGRFSSSFSAFGTGGNLQNVEESLRSIFIADRGMKWAKFDAKQIQSRIVGAIEWKLFKDPTYLDACESIDLHTYVAKLMWPRLLWTGHPKADKVIAETIFWRHFTHRDLCKKIGHGSNFEGLPPTLSAQTGVPVALITAFQPLYFKAFPAHHEWHHWVATQIRTVGHIIGITGRKRWFFGRRNDPDVVRQAIAYDPQASESFIVNSAMLNIWRTDTATVMMHEHDGLVYQYPEAMEDELVPKLLKQLEVTVDIGHGRTLTVPYEAKTGWNRGAFDASTNPEGLRDYTGKDERTRGKEVHVLDRIIRRAHG